MIKYDFIIGIDPGVNTGFAVWETSPRKFLNDLILTTKIHKAIKIITAYVEVDYKILVRVEDARKRKWFGKSGKEKWQGAGSIKRDCTIWEDFLKDLGVDYEMVEPSRVTTKLSPEQFKNLTGYTKRTSNHGRDAAMLVYDYK